MNRLKCLAIIATVFFLVPGCNSRGYKVVQISGKLTYDGKPLGGASINTQPRIPGVDNPGPGSFAQTEPDGSFVLKLSDTEEPGAVPGNHSIIVTTAGYSANPMSDELDPAERNELPDIYQDGSYTQEIPDEDSESWNIDLPK